MLLIGGREFATSLETLVKHKDSYFEKMLKGKQQVEVRQDEAVRRERKMRGSSNTFMLLTYHQGTIFVDRNGSVFELVLDFMRGKQLFLFYFITYIYIYIYPMLRFFLCIMYLCNNRRICVLGSSDILRDRAAEERCTILRAPHARHSSLPSHTLLPVEKSKHCFC